MFNLEVWITFTIACISLTVSPGPGSMLAISKGASQGKVAGFMVAISIGIGTLVHVLAATFGFTLLIHTSEIAFILVKIIGSVYLLWVGLKIILKRNLINQGVSEKEPLNLIFLTGFFTVLLNPRAGIFILAFIPQFVDSDAGSFSMQMFAYGAWFAILSVLILSLMGIFAENVSYWLNEKPKFLLTLNIAAGLIFLASGFSVATMQL